MNRFIKNNKIGLILMAIGVMYLLVGIQRKEHITVAKKSNIICLECIGIG